MLRQLRIEADEVVVAHLSNMKDLTRLTAHDLNTVAMAYAGTFTDSVQRYPG